MNGILFSDGLILLVVWLIPVQAGEAESGPGRPSTR